MTLSQTNSSETTDGVACTGPNTVPADAQYLLENSFYRAFSLADYNVTTAFTVKSVSFGVYSASAGSMTGQPADITIYGYADAPGGTTLNLSQLSPLGNTSIQIPNTATPTVVQVPLVVEVPEAVRVLVVELHVNNGQNAMYKLLVGTNSRGESDPAYLRAPNCSYVSPTPIGQVVPGFSLLLSLTGEA